MLGIGNVVTAGSKVASVVRKDLEAWYKEGESQAPLGEEKINNGYFSLGPNLIKDGPYWFRDNDDSTGDSISADGVALTPNTGSHTMPDSGFRFLTDSSSTHIGVKQDNVMNAVSANNNFYQVSYTIVSNNGTGGLKFNNNEINTPPVTVGPHVIYSDSKSLTNAFLIERRDGGQVTDITIKDVEVREVNPGGNGWLTNQVDVWRFKDGYAQFDHSAMPAGSTAYYITPNRDGNNNNNTFLVANRKYKVSFRISNTFGLANDQNARIAIVRGSSDTDGYKWYTDGYYEVEFEPSASGDLRIYAHNDSAGDFRISEISCREITHSIKDSSPNSHEAKLFSGTCLKFDGSNSPGNPGDVLTLGYTTQVTVWTAAFWLGDYTMGTSSGHDNYDWIIGAAQTQKNIGLRRSETGGPYPFFRQAGVSDEVDGVNVGASYLPFTGYQTSSYSGWKRWVFASDGTHIRLYVDGIYYGKVTPSSSGNGTLLAYRNFMAGAYQTGSHGLGELYAVNGSLSDLQIYHKCWSESDVKYDYNNPNKDVFDRINQPRVLTPSLIPSIENSDFDGTLGNTTTWGAQQLNAGWNNGTGDAQFYSKSGDSITFGPITGSTRLYPPQLVDDVNGLVETKSAVQEVIGGYSTRKYVVKYTILNKVGFPNLKIYTGNTNGYVAIPTDIGSHEFEFTYLATDLGDGSDPNRSNLPLVITTIGSRVTISNFSIHRVLVETPTIQPYDCEVLLRLNEGFGSKLYNAAPILGEELVSNGDFTNSDISDWTAYVNAQLTHSSNNKLLVSPTTASSSRATQGFTTTPGSLYYIRADFDNPLGSTVLLGLSVNANGGSATFQTSTDLSGTISFYYVATAATTYISLSRLTNDTKPIYWDNVSLKEITRQRAAAYIDGNDDTVEWVGQQPHIPQFTTSNYSKRLVHEGTVMHHGTLPAPLYNKAPNNFTVSLWYLPGLTPDDTQRGAIFGLLKDLHANLPGAQTFQSFSIEHWEDTSDANTGDEFYVWSGDGQRSGAQFDDAQQNVNFDHVQMDNDYDSSAAQLINIVVTVGPNGFYKIYNDGKLKASGTPNWKSGGGSYSTVKNFVIGSRRDYTMSQEAFGFIDEISLFNKVLTDDEVREIYNTGNALDIRDHSCYTAEVLQKGDWVSQGVIGDATTPWFKNNQASAQFSCVIGDFKGRTNVMKYECTDANSLNKKLIQEIDIIEGAKYICEVDVWVESGNFRCDSPNSEIDGNFVEANSATGGWVTLTSNVLTALTTSSTAQFWIRPATSTVASEFYVDKVSFKRYDVVSYWRNEGAKNWTDLSPYGANATYRIADYSDVVTNGNFNNGTNNWVGGSGAALSQPVDSNGNTIAQLAVTVPAGDPQDEYGNAYQQVTNLVVGAEYEFSFYLVSKTNRAQIKIDTSATGTSSTLIDFDTNDGNLNVGETTVGRFIAGAVNPYIQLRTFGTTTANTAHSIVVDTISLKRVPSVIKLQEVPLFNRDSLGLPMNRIKGTGLNFEDGYAEIKPRPVTSGNKLSIEAWIYLRDEGFSNQAIYASGSTEILFYRSINNFIRLYINGGNPSQYAGPTCTVSPNEWIHAVAIYDDGKFSMYINGSTSSPGYFEQDPTAGAHPGGNINSSNTIATIGKYSSAAYFGGVIDDVKVYNAVLTPSQVKNNYNATKSKHKNSSVPSWSDDFDSNFG